MSKDSSRHSRGSQHLQTHLTTWLVPQNQSGLPLSSLQQTGPLSRLGGVPQPVRSCPGETRALPTGRPLWPQGPSGRGCLSHPELKTQRTQGGQNGPFPGRAITFLGGYLVPSLASRPFIPSELTLNKMQRLSLRSLRLVLAWLPTTALWTLQPHPGLPSPSLPGSCSLRPPISSLSSPPAVTASEGDQGLLAHAATTLPLLKASFLLPIMTKRYQPSGAPNLSLLPVPPSGGWSHPLRTHSQLPAGLAQKPLPSPQRSTSLLS